MPSLGDVANEVKSLLEDIKANTSTIKGHTEAIKTNTGTIITKISQLDADVKSGFTNLAQALEVLVALGTQANQLSAEHSEQNRTIICWLTNIANTVCEIKHNTDKEVELQEDISATLHHVDDVGELAHASEAMAVANHNEIVKRMNKCCPLPEKPVRPCFEPCRAPAPVKFEPIRTDWRPIRYGSEEKPNE